MAQAVINTNGTLNTCFIFYLRTADCVRRENFFDLMCKEQWDDWQECRLRKRYRSFKLWYANETKQMKILNFPRFDDKTDSFIDDSLPETADSFFENDQKMKDFFDIKPFKKHVETKGDHGHGH